MLVYYVGLELDTTPNGSQRLNRFIYFGHPSVNHSRLKPRSPVVIDIGSGCTKMGFAGNIVGRPGLGSETCTQHPPDHSRKPFERHGPKVDGTLAMFFWAGLPDCVWAMFCGVQTEKSLCLCVLGFRKRS